MFRSCQCELQKEKEGAVERGCAVSKGVTYLWELNKLLVTVRLCDLLRGRGPVLNVIKEIAHGKVRVLAFRSKVNVFFLIHAKRY